MLSRKTVEKLWKEAGESMPGVEWEGWQAQSVVFARLVEARVLENAAKRSSLCWSGREWVPRQPILTAARSARKAAKEASQ